jgi:hypothetical protein
LAWIGVKALFPKLGRGASTTAAWVPDWSRTL